MVCTKESGEEIAGSPSLGEHRKMEVIIEESYEFKVRGIELRKGVNVIGISYTRDSISQLYCCLKQKAV